jgi:hypothetical protein
LGLIFIKVPWVLFFKPMCGKLLIEGGNEYIYQGAVKILSAPLGVARIVIATICFGSRLVQGASNPIVINTINGKTQIINLRSVFF